MKISAPAEWFTAIGGLASVIGYGMKFSGVAPFASASNWVTLVGVAVLLYGVFITVRDVHRRLAAVDTDAIARSVDALRLRVEALAEGHRASATAFTVSRVADWAKANPQVVHFNATSATVCHLLNSYTPSIVSRLEEFTRDQSVELEVRDLSPVHELMWRLGNALPHGGAWFGITLLNSRSAWDTPDESFRQFVLEMRKRAVERDLAVVRIYYFSRYDAFDAMRDLLQEEERSNIVVRCLVGGPVPPDVSLLWSSPARATPSGRPSLSLPQDVVAEARRVGRTPICGLSYHAHGGSLLTRVLMHTGSSREFDTMADTFAEHWRRARSLADTVKAYAPQAAG